MQNNMYTSSHHRSEQPSSTDEVAENNMAPGEEELENNASAEEDFEMVDPHDFGEYCFIETMQLLLGPLFKGIVITIADQGFDGHDNEIDLRMRTVRQAIVRDACVTLEVFMQQCEKELLDIGTITSEDYDNIRTPYMDGLKEYLQRKKLMEQ